MGLRWDSAKKKRKCIFPAISPNSSEWSESTSAEGKRKKSLSEATSHMFAIRIFHMLLFAGTY